MSIQLVSDVFQEARRLAIAGSGLAHGDFRLKKLVDPLQLAGKKSPVLAKVAESINGVIESDAKNASTALLELTTLVTAILYTQGETGCDGVLTPVETSNLDIPTSLASARVLKPLIEALSTKGAGRHEIIVEAHRRGAFKDLRLVKPALDAIDDVYADIGEFVAQHVLPTYGKAIVPELRARLDLKGRGGHARRLLLLNKLDPEGTHALVENVLESGSKEMKLAAIACLKGSKDHLSYILEQARAKAKDVRRAAYEALAEFEEPEVVEVLLKALSGADVEIVAEPVSENPSPEVAAFVVEHGRKQLAELFEIKDGAKLEKALSYSTCSWERSRNATIDNPSSSCLSVSKGERTSRRSRGKGKPAQWSTVASLP